MYRIISILGKNELNLEYVLVFLLKKFIVLTQVY